MTDSEREWWEARENVATLAAYMADHGHTAAEVAYAVEKPWKHEDEYRQALAELDTETKLSPPESAPGSPAVHAHDRLD